jgi:hypothetical protein
MVKLLVDSEKVDLGILNFDKKACYEVYNDQFGFDEAATFLEKLHLKGKTNPDFSLSKLFPRDFKPSQRDTIMDKKVPEIEKVALIENHILNDNFGTDLNFD